MKTIIIELTKGKKATLVIPDNITIEDVGLIIEAIAKHLQQQNY
jgi:hypothetical protein